MRNHSNLKRTRPRTRMMTNEMMNDQQNVDAALRPVAPASRVRFVAVDVRLVE